MTAVAIWLTCGLWVAGAACFVAHSIQSILDDDGSREWL